jgi:DNA topoisomerase I
MKRPVLRLLQNQFLKSAKEAGLIYVSDHSAGYTRKVRGRRFQYFDTRGRPIKNETIIKRINSLAIPPAYENVWICPNPNGHIQAVGYDDRGRKQYRYHPKWRERRDTNKYDKIRQFSRALPIIRKITEKHLNLPGLSRYKVLATVVQLLEKTLIRVGNEEYAIENGSVGLTTMRNRHVKVRGPLMLFRFVGKSGIRHSIGLEDRRLAEIVRACKSVPGYELFQYVNDEGKRCTIRSEDVNSYLKEITGENFSAKDFRTWSGTVLAAKALRSLPMFETEAQAKRNINLAIDSVSKKLGNTKSICRKCYVHPAVLDAYLDGDTIETILVNSTISRKKSSTDLDADERAVIILIARRLENKRTLRQKKISSRKTQRRTEVAKPVAA